MTQAGNSVSFFFSKNCHLQITSPPTAAARTPSEKKGAASSIIITRGNTRTNAHDDETQGKQRPPPPPPDTRRPPVPLPDPCAGTTDEDEGNSAEFPVHKHTHSTEYPPPHRSRGPDGPRTRPPAPKRWWQTSPPLGELWCRAPFQRDPAAPRMIYLRTPRTGVPNNLQNPPLAPPRRPPHAAPSSQGRGSSSVGRFRPP